MDGQIVARPSFTDLPADFAFFVSPLPQAGGEAFPVPLLALSHLLPDRFFHADDQT